MFGRKKKQQQAEEAVRRAEEAEEAAREARAEADALQEKRGLFGRKKKRKEETPAPEEAAPVSVRPEPEPEEPQFETTPKESRRERKLREKEEAKKEARIRDLELQLHKSEKKRRSARFCDFFAFTVLVLAALLMLLEPLLKLILTHTGDAEAIRTVSTVAQYCLLAAIAIPAWYFVYRKGIAWKIVYFVALVAFIVGNILGLTL